MEEATAPYQLDAEHLEFILSYRRTMNLVDAAASLEEALCDEDAADRLHRWLALRPRMSPYGFAPRVRSAGHLDRGGD